MDNEQLIKALSIGFHFLEKDGRTEDARTLLKLRKAIQEGTPKVWTNRRAFRRYQGQDNTVIAPKGYGKYRAILIKEDDEDGEE